MGVRQVWNKFDKLAGGPRDPLPSPAGQYRYYPPYNDMAESQYYSEGPPPTPIFLLKKFDGVGSANMVGIYNNYSRYITNQSL